MKPGTPLKGSALLGCELNFTGVGLASAGAADEWTGAAFQARTALSQHASDIHLVDHTSVRDADFSALPTLPLLRTFHWKPSFLRCVQKASPAQVDCMRRCPALTDLSCGRWTHRDFARNPQPMRNAVLLEGLQLLCHPIAGGAAAADTQSILPLSHRLQHFDLSHDTMYEDV